MLLHRKNIRMSPWFWKKYNLFHQFYKSTANLEQYADLCASSRYPSEDDPCTPAAILLHSTKYA